jgi:hypothetical protein
MRRAPEIVSGPVGRLEGPGCRLRSTQIASLLATRGEHYGQRSCEPHSMAEQMAAQPSLRREKRSCQPKARSYMAQRDRHSLVEILVAHGGIADANVSPHLQAR